MEEGEKGFFCKRSVIYGRISMIPGTAWCLLYVSRAVLGWEQGCWHLQPGQWTVSWGRPLLVRPVRDG